MSINGDKILNATAKRYEETIAAEGLDGAEAWWWLVERALEVLRRRHVNPSKAGWKFLIQCFGQAGLDGQIDRCLERERLLIRLEQECTAAGTKTGDYGLLDDLVHDVYSVDGSDINNGGIGAQVRALVDKCGTDVEGDIKTIIVTVSRP